MESPANTPPGKREAIVFNIQRMSTEDGPGIRTTVFFKGCPLSCEWCHNPESIERTPQIVWHQTRCIACESCIDSCPSEALSLSAAGLVVDRTACKECGTCVEECPTTARECVGKTWTLDDLLAEVVKDRSYFESSGGGITASGGEPMSQGSFVENFLSGCRATGLHTALDTSGLCGKTSLLRAASHADLVLFDLKEIDPERHKELTGHSNERILENLTAIRDQMNDNGGPAQLWIRTPLIPKTTARDETVTRIGTFIAEHLGDAVARWELCSFNNLAEDKYERLGLSWSYAKEKLLSEDELRHFEKVAQQTGVDPAIVHADGPTVSKPTRQSP